MLLTEKLSVDNEKFLYSLVFFFFFTFVTKDFIPFGEKKKVPAWFHFSTWV